MITTSDGEKTEPPKFLGRAEERLKRLQRSLSAREKGSKNRNKARGVLATQHSKVRHQRTDFNQKLSTKLVEAHDLLVFEDLKVRNMVRNHTLAKSISDAAWSQLVSFAEYKAARKGRIFVTVPAPFTTQECDFCGVLNSVALDTREFECEGCHRILDRDVNAARITLKRGIAKVGRDTPELRPVESGPLLVPTTGLASPVDEAGTIRGGYHATQQETHRWKPTNSFVGGCHQLRLSALALTLTIP